MGQESYGEVGPDGLSAVVVAVAPLFDVLAVAGRDLRGLPYRKRRKRLRRLSAHTGRRWR